jgi:ornithine cyclodeaminase
MMPAWQAGDVIGVKLVTVAPENSQKGLPSIQGTYLLFDVDTGSLKATMDAPSLTAKRTAAASALASSLLSRKNSQALLVVGTGTLSPQLIAAHASVRDIKQVYIWGRSLEKAQAIVDKVKHLNIDCQPVTDLAHYVPKADIISCATLSVDPLIKGEWLKPGQHLDMVGAYRPDMREMDDQCLLKATLFVDNLESAVRETGDIAIPLAHKIIKQSDIKADLFALCKNQVQFERNDNEITIFKSVGHALEDLTAAKLVADYAQKKKCVR